VLPARILVIDDEEVVHVSLRRILGRCGHQVEAELSAAGGLERLADDPPYDLVITDLMMPEMNGIELLQRLKELELDVPVLMITGYPTISTALEALRLDAMDYIAKPFTRQELLGPVNRALRRSAGAEADQPAVVEIGPDSEGLGRSCPGMEPGVRMCLRRHSWALCCQDGTVEVGIQPSFFEGIGEVSTVQLPEESDLVEQGYAGIHLRATLGEEHAVFMPLSGRVVAVNEEVVGRPAEIDPDTWLVRILPDRLDTELPRLSLCGQRSPNGA
jgi:CheY-like chemotaxis protein